MSSILNSISSGNLQVQQVPRRTPTKEDDIINLLLNSEIEFDTCPSFKNNIENFNTGFGDGKHLHFETKCKLPNLKTPLYQENYLKEFKTEEEKAAARHALGLFNKGDIVAMSLITTKEEIPSKQSWFEAKIKQMRQGDEFFIPITHISAVYDSSGVTLDKHINNINTLINKQKEEIAKINNVSPNKEITSLGDIRVFLNGFKNGDNLHDTLDDMNQEMLRFEQTGQIQ